MEKFILNGLERRILPNPTIEIADRFVEEARGSKEITSIGGGSTIDIGKYVAWKLNIPHTTIPTTAGTGSEVTRFAVFIKNGKKISFEDDKLIPDNYILDPSRIVSLPPLQTASTGLDAICQAIESWWSPEATIESRSYANRALENVIRNLKQSYENPQSEVLRRRMLVAANFSGKAINITRTSICHAISYPLTIHYRIPHGIACAHTLPYFMRYFGFYKIYPWKIEKLIEFMGAKIDIPFDRELVATQSLEYERAQNTPKPITKEIILEALC